MENNIKVVAIIQARMGSSRLPGKVLKELAGKTILEIIIDRVSLTKGLSEIVLSTTVNKKDDILESWAKIQKIKYFRGNENDVLDRYYQTAKAFQADLIIRITADDPLKDPEIIEQALSFFDLIENLDYCSNTIDPSYPEGLDVEIFKFSALEKAWKEAVLQSEREHVTPFIWKNNHLFKIKNFTYIEDLSNWRWTVDNPEDYEFMQEIFKFFDNNYAVSYKKIISFLKDNMELTEINNSFLRNEGYLQSIKKEKNE